MRLLVLGGGGAWPTPERGCNGYLIEQSGFRLLIDPGYATVPPLLTHVAARDIDAVLISHSHPDHCADLNPLLRVRHLDDDPPSPLPVFALFGAASAVLALDGSMLDADYTLTEFDAGDRITVGPFDVTTRPLAHFVPNAGLRIESDGVALAYTGDGGADPDVARLADNTDLLLAEATYPDAVPEHSTGLLASARDAGRHANAANVRQLVLTHLWPGADPAAAGLAAAENYAGPIAVAEPGVTIDV